MRAVRCHRHGPPGDLVVEEVDDPVPGREEALVAVGAAAVNFPDVLVVTGEYQVRAAVPFVPGSELAGEVLEVGEGVRDLAPGDRVFGTLFVGAFAELAAVPAASLTPVPDGVDLADAAAFGVAHGTAYHTVRSVAGARDGTWVVVLGAGGGVGLAAVEVATLLGADAVAVASTEAKRTAALGKGAVAAVDASSGDLKHQLREIRPEGFDVVVDPVGGPLAEPALRTLRWGGRYVTVGFASGEIPRIPLNLVLLKGVTISGFEMASFMTHRPDRFTRDRDELLAHLGAGRLRPHVSARYPLEEAARALEVLRSRGAIGKLVVEPGLATV